MPAVLAFLGVYYLLVTIAAFVGDPARVAELYRAPDLHAALFFAFFMVTDPPTSPPKHRDQIMFGAIVAVAELRGLRVDRRGVLSARRPARRATSGRRGVAFERGPSGRFATPFSRN